MGFHSALKTADGALTASPEYAHGITGALKTALDWIVASGELVLKPVALLNASIRAVHAPKSLKEVLKTMDARIIEEASITIPNNKIDDAGILADPELTDLFLMAIMALACSIDPKNCSPSLLQFA